MARICVSAFLSLENIYTWSGSNVIQKKLISGKGLCPARLKSNVLCWTSMLGVHMFETK